MLFRSGGVGAQELADLNNSRVVAADSYVFLPSTPSYEPGSQVNITFNQNDDHSGKPGTLKEFVPGQGKPNNYYGSRIVGISYNPKTSTSLIRLSVVEKSGKEQK